MTEPKDNDIRMNICLLIALAAILIVLRLDIIQKHRAFVRTHSVLDKIHIYRS